MNVCMCRAWATQKITYNSSELTKLSPDDLVRSKLTVNYCDTMSGAESCTGNMESIPLLNKFYGLYIMDIKFLKTKSWIADFN